MASAVENSAQVIARLRALLAGVAPVSEVIPTGLPVLDAVLPNGGLRRGSVVDCGCDVAGGGAMSLALWIAARVQAGGGGGGDKLRMTNDELRNSSSVIRHSSFPSHSPVASPGFVACPGFVLIVDLAGDFHAAAGAALGLDLKRLAVVRPRRQAEAVWVMDQALRCSAVGAVVARLPRLAPAEARRLQLAAEAGGGIGIVLGTCRDRQRSFAATRLEVRPGRMVDEELRMTNDELRMVNDGLRMTDYERKQKLQVTGDGLRTDRMCSGEPAPQFLPVTRNLSLVTRHRCFHPSSVIRHPSPRGRLLHVFLTRVQEGKPAGPVKVVLPDEANLVPVSSATGYRATGEESDDGVGGDGVGGDSVGGDSVGGDGIRNDGARRQAG